jgi:alanine racemase
MLNFVRKLIKPKYETLNEVQIVRKNILANFDLLQLRQPLAEIFPVLKSNAYGHGLKEICQILNESAARLVIIDSFPEAQIVYKNFKRKVLFLSELPLPAYAHCRMERTEFCVYNFSTFKYLAKKYPGIQIHLFVNTGMNREGINDLDKFLDQAKDYLKRVQIVGLCSHLASADVDSDLNKLQSLRFFKALETLNKNKIYPRSVHLGNSAGIFTLNDKRLTAYRAGIGLYGYNVFSETSPFYKEAGGLKPALRLLSTITGFQNLKAGDSVSYGETYRATADTKIALVPFGYYEGLDRRLSNLAEFKILANKVFVGRVAGRVCMNLVCLDCGQNDFKVGERVEIISLNSNDPNSLYSLANIGQTIIYEILVKLQANIRREII